MLKHLLVCLIILDVAADLAPGLGVSVKDMVAVGRCQVGFRDAVNVRAQVDIGDPASYNK